MSDVAPPSASAVCRKILHVDMDAFYASVEQRDNPELRGRPVAVGGTRERGVVAAASYEARRYGVRSAMSSAAARRRCPDLIFVKPRFEVYKEISRQVREIFASHTDLIEPLSLDEAYLDVTTNRWNIAWATDIARIIRRDILDQTGLTASAGVSYNKFLAKLASDHNKPDGLCVIVPGQGEAFVAALDIGKFHGVGPVTATKMRGLGIRTGADLRAQSRDFLAAHFGRWGDYLYAAARGLDDRPVRPNRVRKSVGSETTFFQDLTSREDLVAGLEPSIDKVWRHCEQAGLAAKTVTLKAKYGDFAIVTRSRSLPGRIASHADLHDTALDLLSGLFPLRMGLRLLGVSLSNLAPEEAGPAGQLPLL